MTASNIMMDKAYITFRNHPILDDAIGSLEGENKDELVTISRKHLRFIYPKTILFSFAEYPSDEYFSFGVTSDESLASDIYTYEKGRVRGLLKQVVEYFHQLNSGINFILDIRRLRGLDETLLSEITSELENYSFVPQIIAPKELYRSLTSLKLEGAKIYYDARGVFGYLEGLVQKEGYSDLVFKGVVSLKRIEELISIKVIKPYILDNYTVTLNLEKVDKFTVFSGYMLTYFIQYIALKYGVVTVIDFRNTKSRVEAQIKRLVSAHENPVFVRFRDEEGLCVPQRVNDSDLITIGTSSTVNVLQLSDIFLSRIARRETGYLSEYVAKKYVPKNTIYKPYISRQPRIYVIRNIIYELTENISDHSGGVGLISATVLGGYLYLFIGDSGIGLKKGILKNYKLEDEISSDVDALNLAFNLNEYQDRRKDRSISNLGGGVGLHDSVASLLSTNGRLLVITGNAIKAYLNPVSGVSKKIASRSFGMGMSGTIYFILIPITKTAEPTGSLDKFLSEY